MAPATRLCSSKCMDAKAKGGCYVYESVAAGRVEGPRNRNRSASPSLDEGGASTTLPTARYFCARRRRPHIHLWDVVDGRGPASASVCTCSCRLINILTARPNRPTTREPRPPRRDRRVRDRGGESSVERRSTDDAARPASGRARRVAGTPRAARHLT